MARLLSDVKKERGRIVIALKNAIVNTFGESEWKDLGYRTGTHDWIESHGRLLRSLRWGDSDYEGNVLDAVAYILKADRDANLALIRDTPQIAKWLAANDPEALALMGGPAAAVVQQEPLKVSSKAVEEALSDAEVLIKAKGPSSAVDRVHTALHGYLVAVCNANTITYEKNPSLTHLFKQVRTQHPALQDLGAHAEQIQQVLYGCASIIHVINELRNQASGAHPNDPLEPEEAMLVINATRTIKSYLNAKL